jgi:hypothetical protein
MNTTLTEKLTASRAMLQEFGRHYDYDVSYLEALMDASPEAFLAFEAAMPMARVRKEAPLEALLIAKLAAIRAQDCGPCTVLSIKMAREAGFTEDLIREVLRGEGLTEEQRDIYDYARAVALNEDMDPALLPRLQRRLGPAVVAELAVNILATKLYPTMKRALGFEKSCSLMPELAA